MAGENSQPRALPAFIISENNSYEYTCILPIDPNSGVVIVDTKACDIKRGDRNTIATRIKDFLRGAGIPSRVVG